MLDFINYHKYVKPILADKNYSQPLLIDKIIFSLTFLCRQLNKLS